MKLENLIELKRVDAVSLLTTAESVFDLQNEILAIIEKEIKI